MIVSGHGFRFSFPGRRFELWEYTVSHGSMLVRSPRGPGVETNIDLIFVGVEYVAAPRHFAELELVDATDADVARVAVAVTLRSQSSRVFVLRTGDERHLVVAAGCRIDENRHDIFYSAFDFPHRAGPNP